jgi:DNA-binding transcriptional MerR regulator
MNRPNYAKNELIEWIDLMEKAKAAGLTPEDMRHFLENERELSA